jgi:hypothetical protein
MSGWGQAASDVGYGLRKLLVMGEQCKHKWRGLQLDCSDQSINESDHGLF